MRSEVLFLCAYLVFSQLQTCFGGANQRRKMQSGCPPIKLKYGRVRIRGRFFAEFVCARGYILAGDRYSKCTQGIWDSDPPVCVRPNCQKFQKLKNGVIHPSHRGGVLNFYCLANYVLQGPKQAYCVDMKWSTHMPTCLPTNTTASLSCDFENEDICGWTQDLNHNFDWTRSNFKTPSGHLATGPSNDHTKGPGEDGYYMYIEGSTRNMNDTARLISPTYRKESNNTCLEFYYHMYGSGIGQLRVYVKKVNETWNLKAEDAVFLKDGNQGNEWWRGFVDLGPIDDQFQVIFEGVRGHSFISDIAIDDVKIIENCNTDLPTITETTLIYDSCSNRCNTSVAEDPMSCRCDEDCAVNNTCCPDYIVFCVLGTETYVTDYATEEYTTELDEWTTLRSVTALPILRATATPEFAISTQSSIVSTMPTLRPTAAPKFAVFTRSPTVSALTTLLAKAAPGSTTLPAATTKIMNTPAFPSTTWLPIRTKPDKSYSTASTAPSEPNIPVTITSQTPTTKIATPSTTQWTGNSRVTTYFLNDMLTVPLATSTMEETPLLVTEQPKIIDKEYPADADLDHPVLSDKVAPIQGNPVPSNGATVIAVLTVCFIVVGILGLVFLAKRYSGRSWMSVRRMRSGNGDSQSEIRFLTSDEILDFTLATPSSNY